MMKQKMNRILALLLTIATMATLLSACGSSKTDEKDNGEKAPEQGAHVATLFAGGNYESKRDLDSTAKEFDALLAQTAADGVEKIDGALFCGGYHYTEPIVLTDEEVEKPDLYQPEAANLEGSISNMKASLSEQFGLTEEQMVFTQGDREYRGENSALALTGPCDPEDGKWGAFSISEKDFGWSGTTRDNETSNLIYTASLLENYLNKKLDEKFSGPIFIMSHIPLGACNMQGPVGDKRKASPRTLMTVMNDAGERGLNIIYLYANAHYLEWDTYRMYKDDFLTVGDTLMVPGLNDDTQAYTLNFSYVNVGYTGGNTVSFDNIDDSIGAVTFDIYENSVTVQRHSIYVSSIGAKDTESTVLYEADGKRFCAVADSETDKLTIHLTTPFLSGFSLSAQNDYIAQVYGDSSVDYTVNIVGKDPFPVDFADCFKDGTWTAKTSDKEVATVEGLKVTFLKSGNVTVTFENQDKRTYDLGFTVQKKTEKQAKAHDYLQMKSIDRLLDGMKCILSIDGEAMLPEAGKNGMKDKKYDVFKDAIVSVAFPELEWTLIKADDGFKLTADGGELTADGDKLTLTKSGTVFTLTEENDGFAFTSGDKRIAFDETLNQFVMKDSAKASALVYVRIPF